MEDKIMNETMREMQDTELERVSGGEQDGGPPQIETFTAEFVDGRFKVSFKMTNAQLVQLYIDGYLKVKTSYYVTEKTFYFTLTKEHHSFFLEAYNSCGEDTASFECYVGGEE